MFKKRVSQKILRATRIINNRPGTGVSRAASPDLLSHARSRLSISSTPISPDSISTALVGVLHTCMREG